MYNNNYEPNNIVVFDEKAASEKPKKIKFLASAAGVLAVVILGGAVGFGVSTSVTDTLKPKSVTRDAFQLDITRSDTERETRLSSERLKPSRESGEEYTTEELYQSVKDSVVGIKMYRVNPYTRQETGRIVASGVIFTSDGYLLTNHHVISDGGRFAVMVNDYDDESEIYEYPAEIIGSDEPTDLAILKIEREQGFRPAAIGDSDKLRIGQTVCPIGNPMGLSKSMTKGIVSGLNRESKFELSSIQIDAAVNMGNSGGPLFDMYGNVVGIVNEKYSSLMYESVIENIGFAITINEAKPIINDLIAHGEVVSRPMLGVTIMPLNEYTASHFGISGVKEGLLVTSVQPRSSAYKNGIAVGDVIVKINDSDVAYSEDVQSVIRKLKVGDKITLTVARMDTSGRVRKYDVEVTLIASAD